MEYFNTFSEFSNNDIFKNETCGCFHCLSIFNPNQISEWIPYSDNLAICPYCGIDSVIGTDKGKPITKTYLKEFKEDFFSKYLLNTY